MTGGPRPGLDYGLVVRLALESASRGGTYAPVADALGCSRERVRQILASAGVLPRYHELKAEFETALREHLKSVGMP